MSLRILIILILFITGSLAKDNKEQRFNPPIKGCYLGIVIEETKQGFWVKEIAPGSAAERSGIEKDDIIVRLGDWRFNLDNNSFQDYLKESVPSKTIIQVLRDGSEMDIEIKPDSLLVKDAKEINRLISRNRLFKDQPNLEELLIGAIRKSSDNETAYRKLNQIVDTFGLSHTAIITPWVANNLFGEGEKFHLGLFIQKINHNGKDGFFIRSMMHGSQAREAGLSVGDEVLSINKYSISNSPRLTLAGYEHRRQMYTIMVDKNETIDLEFKRTKDGEKNSIKISADRALSAENSIRKSMRLIPLNSTNQAGYIHLWNFMSRDNAEVLKDAMSNNFSQASALIIDLRGRGGRVDVIRTIARMLSSQKKPTILIIDGESRSAKEMLAHRLQGLSHVTLVGEVTAGAVLPATFEDLTGGAKLMIPSQRGDSQILPFMKNTKLEGRGAIPDVKVNSEIPYSQGKDLILLKSIGILKKEIQGELLRI